MIYDYTSIIIDERYRLVLKQQSNFYYTFEIPSQPPFLQPYNTAIRFRSIPYNNIRI